MIFTIHFGGFPPIFGNIHIYTLEDWQLEPENDGLVRMMFLFNWVVFRRTMLIFRSVPSQHQQFGALKTTSWFHPKTQMLDPKNTKLLKKIQKNFKTRQFWTSNHINWASNSPKSFLSSFNSRLTILRHSLGRCQMCCTGLGHSHGSHISFGFQQ